MDAMMAEQVAVQFVDTKHSEDFARRAADAARGGAGTLAVFYRMLLAQEG